MRMQRYIDRCIADLTRYHVAGGAAMQQEIDGRFGSMSHVVEGRFTSLDLFRDAMRDTIAGKTDSGEFAALSARVDRVEKLLDQQRGRMTVYAALGGLVLVLIALLTLAVNHIQL